MQTINTKPSSLYTINNISIFDATAQSLKSSIQSKTIIIPHVCNNVNVFGAGFAKAVGDMFPEVKYNYHLLGKSFLQQNLGYVQFIDIKPLNKINDNKLIIANMIAQNGTTSSKNPRPLNYGALAICMYRVKSYIKEIKYNFADMQNIEIHAPKFGSGLAGGNWNFISDMIKDIWTDTSVFIYTKK